MGACQTLRQEVDDYLLLSDSTYLQYYSYETPRRNLFTAQDVFLDPFDFCTPWRKTNFLFCQDCSALHHG